MTASSDKSITLSLSEYKAHCTEAFERGLREGQRKEQERSIKYLDRHARPVNLNGNAAINGKLPVYTI